MKRKMLSLLAVTATLAISASPVYAATQSNSDTAQAVTSATVQTVTTATPNPNFGFLPDWPDDDD